MALPVKCTTVTERTQAVPNDFNRKFADLILKHRIINIIFCLISDALNYPTPSVFADTLHDFIQITECYRGNGVRRSVVECQPACI